MLDQVHAALRGNRGNVLTEELIEGILLRLSRLPAPVPEANPLYPHVLPAGYHDYMFAAEPFEQALPELRRLHQLHWQETEAYRHGLALNMDYDGYLRQERSGQFVQFTVRHHGVLVGNFGAYLYRSMHTGTLAAKEDTYFLDRDHRKGFLAINFGKYVEQALTPFGVRELYASVKNVNRAGKVLEFNGYKAVGALYAKMIGDDNHVCT